MNTEQLYKLIQADIITEITLDYMCNSNDVDVAEMEQFLFLQGYIYDAVFELYYKN